MGLSELNVGQFHFRILGGAGLTGTRLSQVWGWNTGSSNAGENMKTDGEMTWQKDKSTSGEWHDKLTQFSQQSQILSVIANISRGLSNVI